MGILLQRVWGDEMSDLSGVELRSLLRPEFIAIIGASRVGSSGGYAGRLLSNLLHDGFPNERIFLVNPKYDEIDNRKCFPSILDVPVAVDLAIIVVSAKLVIPVVKECVEKGVRAALIFSAGFAEAGSKGIELQKELSGIVRDGGMVTCGPNSIGIVVPANHLAAHGYPLSITFSPGNIGLVSQSGGLAFAAMLSPALDRDIQFSHVIHTGNEAALSSMDVLQYLVEEPDTKVVCCFLEGLKDTELVKGVAERALSVGKPVIVLKVGRTETAAKASLSHTGALTGADNVYEGVFEQTGLIRVPYPDDALELANMFAHCPEPVSDGVVIASTSGGLCSFLGDMFSLNGIDLPPLSREMKDYITSREYLLVYGEPSNPLDVRGQGGPHLDDVFQPFLKDNRYGLLVAVFGVTAFGPISEHLARPLVEFSKNIDKPLVVLWLGKKLNDKWEYSENAGFRMLEKNGIPVFYNADKLIFSVKKYFEYYRFRRRWLDSRDKEKALIRSQTSVSSVELATFLEMHAGVLDEVDSRYLLSCYGISTPAETLVQTEDQAVEAAESIGYPVVIKGVSKDLPHKTEAGVVRLNLKGEASLREAYRAVTRKMASAAPQIELRGILVQSMIEDAREMLIGVTQDEQFGPVLACGLGGVFVDILKDVRFRTVPLSLMDAELMVSRLKGAQFLDAFRGMGPADKEALYDTIVRVGWLARDLKDHLLELDINPLLVGKKGHGVCAVDSVVRLKDKKGAALK